VKRYFNRENAELTYEAWTKLKDDPEYAILGHYENDKFEVIASWIGVCDMKIGEPTKYAKPFRLLTYVITYTEMDGTPLKVPRKTFDPTSSSDFRTEKQLVAMYEDFLVNYCGCEWVPGSVVPGEMRFIERGNKRRPLDKDVPIVEDGVDDSDYGTW
jgi:hypothetical protein